MTNTAGIEVALNELARSMVMLFSTALNCDAADGRVIIQDHFYAEFE
ncbi:MAG: hypothetical protein M1339_06715 [Bacteroidetes bacterium]|nr:hypothetical protein [Bacteroidota bacterium]